MTLNKQQLHDPVDDQQELEQEEKELPASSEVNRAQIEY
jgi:hypothetical protein